MTNNLNCYMVQNDIIKGRDIVIVGQQPWDVEIGSTCKNIALEFSRLNRVLYVNSPLDRITLIREKNTPRVQHRLAVVKGKLEGIVPIKNNLWSFYPDCVIESINWFKNAPVFNYINKINNKKFAQAIKRAINVLGFKDFILFNDNELFRAFYLKEYLTPALSIYYFRDFMLAYKYWKFHGTRLEPELIAKSDLCIANSMHFANYTRRYNPNSFCVGTGCDLKLFDHRIVRAIPEDVLPIAHRIIGYVGALMSLRLDIDLLIWLAEQRPQWSIVLVGPMDEKFKQCRLHEIKNVFFLGAKQVDELPAYINSFDVCINPQVVNEVTIGNYPLKIDEYLAMGKPVVATKTEAMSIFADHTYLASNRSEYLSLTEKALNDDNATLHAERTAFAATHSWENTVKEIYRAINTFEN